MATTAKSATRANERKNAAVAAASVATPKKAAAKPEAADSPNTVQAAPALETPPAPTVEEHAAALQREIEERTRQLQAALTDLTRKKELNDHRTRFLKTLDDLAAAEEQLNQEDEFNSNDVCKIVFQGKPDGYRWETIFSIGNADLQREFITFIRKKIRAKVDEIEAELIK